MAETFDLDSSERVLLVRTSKLPHKDNGGKEEALVTNCFAGRYYNIRMKNNRNNLTTQFTFYNGKSKKYALTEPDIKKSKVSKAPARPVNSFLYARNFLRGVVTKKGKKSTLFVSKVISDVSILLQ